MTLFVVLYLLLSLAAGFFGRNRAFGFWGFFLTSMIFSPIATLLVLLLTHREPPRRRA